MGIKELVARGIEHRAPHGVGVRQSTRVRFQLKEVDEPIETEMPAEEGTAMDLVAQ